MEKIFENISVLPWWGILIILIILVPLYLFKDPLSVKLKNLKIGGRNREISDLVHHSLFLTCDDVKQKVGILDFSEDGESPIKNFLMKRLIELKMDSVKKHYKLLLENDDLESMESMQFHSVVSTTLFDLVKEYNEQALSEFINRGLSKEDASYFINTYEVYRETCVEGFISRLNSICTSNVYDDNFDRILTVLEISALAMDIIVIDVQSVSVQINGRFKKYK